MSPRTDILRKHSSPAAVRGQAAVRWVWSMLKRHRPPVAPNLEEYDEVIIALDKWRRRRGIPPVFDIRRAVEQRVKRPASRPIPSIAPSDGHYDYVPGDDLEVEQPRRGYQP